MPKLQPNLVDNHGYFLTTRNGTPCGYFSNDSKRLEPNVKYQVIKFRDNVSPTLYFTTAYARSKFISANALHMKQMELYAVSLRPVDLLSFIDEQPEAMIITGPCEPLKTKIAKDQSTPSPVTYYSGYTGNSHYYGDFYD